MSQIAASLLLTACVAGTSSLLIASDKSPTDSPSAFFKRLNLEKTPFKEFLFLSGAEVQQNPTWRGLSSQMLATQLSILGRPSDAVREFPIRNKGAAPAGLPDTAGFEAVPAANWIEREAQRYRVIMVNEAHHVPQTRLLTLALLPKLRAQGFNYFAVEALVNDGRDPLASGVPVLRTGSYTRDPVFAELLREATRLGYQLVPYETPAAAGETQQQRETGQARVLANLVAKHPDAKVLVHAGYGHIGEEVGGMPADARPMAMEFMEMSALSVLSIDQTSTGWEEGRAAARLASEFKLAAPAVLVERRDRAAWSARPGRYDVSVVLPASKARQLRPEWLSLGGRRPAFRVDLNPCLGRFPCLAEAHHEGEGEDAIPADQFVVLDASELLEPLYLSPGQYRLRLTGSDGALLTQSTLTVPTAAEASATQHETP